MVIFQEAAVFLRSFGWTNVLICEGGLPFQTTYSLSIRSTGNVQAAGICVMEEATWAGGGVEEHQQSCLQPFAELSLFYIIHTINLVFFTWCSPNAPRNGFVCRKSILWIGISSDTDTVSWQIWPQILQSIFQVWEAVSGRYLLQESIIRRA